ncbi:MAG: Hsp20/alpha crystallin family protein [Aquificaceae bacterium]
MRRGLMQWNPFAELERIRREFDKLFDELAPTREAGAVIAPAVDVYETDSEIVVKAEMPGIKREDIEVSLKDNALYIRGEKKQEHEEKTETIHRIERVFGKFERVIVLPPYALQDSAKAEFKDGILEIRFQKSEGVKEKKLQIG